MVTDSLRMAGVTRGRSPGRTAVQAMRAGADVLLMPPSPAVARAALVKAVRSGTLPRRRLEQSAARQIALLTHLAATGGAGRRRRVRGAARPAACPPRRSPSPTARARAGSSATSCTPTATPARSAPSPRRPAGRPSRCCCAARRRAARRRRAEARAPQEGGQAALQEAAAGVEEGREPPRAPPRCLDRPRGRPARGRHRHRFHRLPRRPGRRRGRGRHGHPVGAGPGRRARPHRDLRRHPGAMEVLVDVLLGRATAPGRLPVQGGRAARSRDRLLRRAVTAVLRSGLDEVRTARPAGPCPARRPG